MRIKFVVAYDGTDFRGWARSPGHRTVRDVLTEAIHRVSGEDVDVIGASRTDSGAHAQGQVCHFDTNVPIENSKWPTVINRVLPDDVAVLSAEFVSDDFNARFCAEDRSYRYRIRQTGRDPFAGRYAHEYGYELDLGRMQEAARLLVGTHDFRAYTENLDPSVDNTIRTLRDVQVSEVGPEPSWLPGKETWIDIVGTAFLRGMMRRISGVLLEVGAGKRDISSVADLLASPQGEMHRPVVLPAKGLCLMRVRFGEPPRDCRNKD